MSRYAELHSHTHFSFLDGASSPYELVATAAELGYSALGITDHNGFYGAAHIAEAARKHGLPIVYGAEIGLPDSASDTDEGDPIRSAEAWDERGGPFGGDYTPAEPIWLTEQGLNDATGSGEWKLVGESQGSIHRRGRSIQSHGTKPTDLPPTNPWDEVAG